MANKDNPINGADFENICRKYFSKQGIILKHHCTLKIGANKKLGDHKFDFKSEKPKYIIECKSHTWTEGNNSPSAKMSVWNEAMYYFSLTPRQYKRILFEKKSINSKNNRTLAQHYIMSKHHLIPPNTEIWEFDVEKNKPTIVYPIAK